MVASSYSREMLLSLYEGLIKENNVTANRLHQWRVDGTLISEIEAIYEAMPLEARGERYSWFLSNKDVLENPNWVMPADLVQAERDMDTRMWVIVRQNLTGHSTTTMRAFLRTLDEPGRDCWELGRLLFDSLCPGYASMLWMQFGFCVCPTREDELKLFVAFRSLLAQCPFLLFCHAYSKDSLIALFRLYNIAVFPSPATSPIFYYGLIDVLSVPLERRQSVWWLKRLANLYPKDSDIDLRSLYPFNVSYGFLNCRDKKEAQTLMDLYRNFFSSAGSNPLELEKARRAGRLAEFFFKDLGIKMGKKRRKQYTRWLTNHPISITPLPGEAVDPRWMRLYDSLLPSQTVAAEVVVEAPAVFHVKDNQKGPNRGPRFPFTRSHILEVVESTDVQTSLRRRFGSQKLVLLSSEKFAPSTSC